MQCDFLFPTPVWHGDIELNVDSLMAFAMPLMNPEPMEYGSYESTYVSASGYRNGKCVVSAMVDKIEEMANDCFQELGPLNTYCEIDYFWFTLTPPGQCIGVHSHPGAVLGGTTYLMAHEGAGSLTIRRNLLESHQYLSLGGYTSGSKGNTPVSFTSYSYPPQVGKIIMFPGWCPHSVGRNNSDHDRMSLSFNMAVKHGVYPKLNHAYS